MRNSAVLPSAGTAPGGNSLSKRKTSNVNRSIAHVSFAQDFSVESMPNPLDFHASYQNNQSLGPAEIGQKPGGSLVGKLES